MNKCIECAKLDLQANQKHAQLGFGHCLTTPVGSFYSFSKPACELFKAAPREIVEKRIEFDRSSTKEK